MLELAESSISRTNPSRAAALAEEGRRNAALLLAIERDPARYLNAVYPAVMFAQNGSAILVAVLAERYVGQLGVRGVRLVGVVAALPRSTPARCAYYRR